MPKVPGEPLRKVTLNLFDKDVAWVQEHKGQGYTEWIREIVHNEVEFQKAELATEQGAVPWPTR